MIKFMFEYLGNPSRIQFAVYCLSGITVLFVFKAIYLSIVNFILARYTWGLRERICRDLVKLYVSSDHQNYLSKNPIQMVTYLTNDPNGVTSVSGAFITLICDIVFLCAVVALLIRTDPLIAAGGMLLIVVGAGVFLKFILQKSKVWSQLALRGEHERRRHATYTIQGLKELRIVAKEFYFADKFLKASKDNASAVANFDFIERLTRPWLETVAVVGLLGLSLSFMAVGRTFDSLLPVLVLMAAIGLRSLPAISRLLNAVQRIGQMAPSIDNLSNEFDRKVPIPVSPNTKARISPEPFEELIIDNLTFKYQDENSPTILSHLNLRICSGETIGIIGESGSGKSTLVDLILGLLIPSNGTISVNGQPIYDDLNTWQSRLGYLPQSVFIYEDTLAANIAIGIPNSSINSKQLQKAIRGARLDKFVSDLPLGTQAVIGESGTRISGGQRQRLGIARILYLNSEIMLLDEPTISLDEETSTIFWETLLSQHHDETIIVVSHDSNIIERCDRVYRIGNGKAEIIDQPPA